MDHRRDDDGCSVFVIKEYAYDVLKTPVTTAIGHPVVCVAIGVSKLCSFEKFQKFSNNGIFTDRSLDGAHTW